MRGDLPAARYRRGMADVPQLSTGRPRKNTQARSGVFTGPRPGENTGALPRKHRVPTRENTGQETEVTDAENSKRKRLKRPSSETSQRGAAATRPEHSDLGSVDSSSMNLTDAPPGYLDEGITSYIVD